MESRSPEPEGRPNSFYMTNTNYLFQRLFQEKIKKYINQIPRKMQPSWIGSIFAILLIGFVGIFYTHFFYTNLGKILAITLILIATYINTSAGFLTLVAFLVLYKFEYYFQKPQIKAFVINLDKNTERYRRMAAQMDVCDLFSKKPETNGTKLLEKTDSETRVIYERFPAINGKKLELSEVTTMTPKTIAEIEKIERTKKRTHHHQLTSGAVGCFMSHLTIYQNLVEDLENNMYMIFEDDAVIPPIMKAHVDYSLRVVPNDWDIILYSWIRLGATKTTERAIDRAKFFWGMQCYMINKQGAAAITAEVANGSPIDGQIDSYLSRMIKQGKLVVYTYNKRIVTDNSQETDIQIPLVMDVKTDPYDYGGYIMR
jgi:GR25 family glycosyltransferase involved in LPS biosynthesis